MKRHPELTATVRHVMTVLAGERHPANAKLHKLGGVLKGCFGASISYGYRIVFVFGPGTICFIDIGTHDEVYR
ncbi:plasmid stabilization protein [Candidatus Uhrbacteria bacterium]|nr:plasmid stabilization protein [Candidatus Uhrbacteria bacterium]